MTLETHTFLHVSRVNKRGGRVGIFLSNSFKKIVKKLSVKWETFELMEVSCEIAGRKSIFIVVYQPPESRVNTFIEELCLYLESVDMVNVNVFICGDFNIWLEDTGNSSVIAFTEMMYSFNFNNKVNEATSVGGHVLDLVFSDSDHDPVQRVCIDEVCCISPVHKLITFEIRYLKEPVSKKRIIFRLKKNFQPKLLVNSVTRKISEEKTKMCEHGVVESEQCVTCYVMLYNKITREKYNTM